MRNDNPSFKYPVGSNVRFLYNISNMDSNDYDAGPYFSIGIGQKAEVRGEGYQKGWLQVAWGGNVYHIDSRFVVSEEQWDRIVNNVVQYTKLTYQR